MSKPFVAILMGSDSDVPLMEITWKELQSLNIPFEVNILSAHRTPTETTEYVLSAQNRGCAIFIAAAGLAAHLAGTVAAHTIRPVIGVPVDAGSLGGFDALLSTVQMPGGTPVACVSIGKAGAKNAALLAAQILAITDADLMKKLQAQRIEKKDLLKKAQEKIKEQLLI